MTQKELNYIEDVVNHERLLIAALENNTIEDEKCSKLLESQIEAHQTMINKFLKEAGGEN